MKKNLFFALAMLVVACEKPVLDEDITSTREANVILHMTQFEQESFGTRAATDITELCSRLNVAIFDADGTKVKTVAQKEGDTGYGTVALTLAAGTYQLVVIAHNGEGSATITSTEKVTFPLYLPTYGGYDDGHHGAEDVEEAVRKIGYGGHSKDRALRHSAGVPRHENAGDGGRVLGRAT